MSELKTSIRSSVEHSLDMLEMSAFNQGFEAAINAVDELSNELHNTNDKTGAEILRWVAKELRGENA
jgi:hypothetical protein